MSKLLLIDAKSSWLIRRKDLLDLELIGPPLGLMYIASYLKNKFKNRIHIKVISKMVDFKTEKDLVVILKEYNPDVVGIRGQHIFKEIFHNIAAVVKQVMPKAIAIGGGPYITADFLDAVCDRNVDYLVIGEGEITFAEIIEKILNNESLQNIKGIVYRDNGKIIENAPREFIENLDALPFPDYNFISIDKYGKFMNYGYNRRRQGLIFSSRGCPYRCIFCHNIFGKTFRTRSSQNVFAEIEKLHKDFGINNFYFVDDAFNLDYNRAMEIFDLIIKSGIKINLYFPNGIRGDIIDRDFIDKMVEAGVIWISYAIETASLRLQKFIKKYNNLDKIANNIHYTCKKNIMVNYFVIVGFPTETKDEALETIKYLKQFKKVTFPQLFSAKYYPNTEMCGLALRSGIKIENIKDAYLVPYQDRRYSETPFISRNEFWEIYFKFVQEIFLTKERLRNAIEIQKRFLTKQEILDFYSIVFRKRVESLNRDVLYYAT